MSGRVRCASLVIAALLGTPWLGGVALAQAQVDPVAASTPQGPAVVVARNGKTYPMGGFDPAKGFLTMVEEFDPRTASRTRKAGMPRPRYGHAAVEAANGRIYVLGGYYFDGLSYLDLRAIYPDAVDEHDPATDAWRERGTLATPRAHAAAAAVGRRIYVAGGHDPDRGDLASAEPYDTQDGVWALLPDMPTPRAGLVVGALPDGRVLAVGGRGRSVRGLAVEAYDPAHDRWETPSWS